MVKLQFHPIDVTYKVINNEPVMHLFGTTPTRERICVLDKFKPYFYVILKDNDDIEQFRKSVENKEIEKGDILYKIESTSVEDKKYIGRNVKAIKITTNLPSAVPVIREEIKTDSRVKEILEADILFTRRYLVDKKIIPLTLYEIKGEESDQRLKVKAINAKNITQISNSPVKNPRILALDIETYNPSGKNIVPEKNPIIMAALAGDGFSRIITWKAFKTSLDNVEFVASEATLIEKIKEIIENYKPDILGGYFSDGFDWPYIITRAAKYKIKLDLGLDHSLVRLGKGKQSTVHITGMAHLDIFKFIKNVAGGTLKTDSYSLNAVAKELLNEEKDEINLDLLHHVWDHDTEQLENYCKYNLQDANLTLKLIKKLFPGLAEMVKTVGLTLNDISRMSFSQLVEWYLIKQTNDFRELIPNKPKHREVAERRQHTYKGAFVYAPKPGLYKNIVVFDFRSLYPTIIASHNIGPSSLLCSCCRMDAELAPLEKENIWFCKKKKVFIPSIIEGLITRRMRIKEMMREKEDLFLNARQESLKTLANAFYGYLGFYASRWYSLESARAVTAYGRDYILNTIKKATEKGFNVIYSDTDSIFITYENKTEGDALNFIEEVNKDLPGLMELELEDLYPRGIFVSARQGAYGAKKKYALISKKGIIKIKGFETVRRDWSTIAKETQEKVLDYVLRKDSPEKAFNYVSDVIKKLRKKEIPLDKVVIHTRLQKDIDEYDQIGPHVMAGKRMKQQDLVVDPGTVVQYIIIQGSEKIRDRARLPDEVKEGNYDANYYVNNQIVPAVERIFQVLGYKKEDLTASKTQNKLDVYF